MIRFQRDPKNKNNDDDDFRIVVYPGTRVPATQVNPSSWYAYSDTRNYGYPVPVSGYPTVPGDPDKYAYCTK